MSASKGNQENAISGKQQDSVQKETLAASATATESVERKHNRPLLFQGRRHTMTEENLLKESLPEAVVPQEGEIKKCADVTLQEHCEKESGCKFVEKCVFRHTEIDSQPNKKPKKSGGKGSVASWKNSKQLGCVSQDIEPPKSKSMKSTKFLGQKRSVQFSKGTIRHGQNRKNKGSIAGCYSA